MTSPFVYQEDQASSSSSPFVYDEGTAPQEHGAVTSALLGLKDLGVGILKALPEFAFKHIQAQGMNLGAEFEGAQTPEVQQLMQQERERATKELIPMLPPAILEQTLKGYSDAIDRGDPRAAAENAAGFALTVLGLGKSAQHVAGNLGYKLPEPLTRPRGIFNPSGKVEPPIVPQEPIKPVEAAPADNPAPEFATIAQQAAKDVTTQKAEATIEQRAQRTAVAKWNASTPEERAALFPDVTDAANTGWKELTKEQRSLIRAATQRRIALKDEAAAAKAAAKAATDTKTDQTPSVVPQQPPIETALNLAHSDAVAVTKDGKQFQLAPGAMRSTSVSKGDVLLADGSYLDLKTINQVKNPDGTVVWDRSKAAKPTTPSPIPPAISSEGPPAPTPEPVAPRPEGAPPEGQVTISPKVQTVVERLRAQREAKAKADLAAAEARRLAPVAPPIEEPTVKITTEKVAPKIEEPPPPGTLPEEKAAEVSNPVAEVGKITDYSKLAQKELERRYDAALKQLESNPIDALIKERVDRIEEELTKRSEALPEKATTKLEPIEAKPVEEPPVEKPKRGRPPKVVPVEDAAAKAWDKMQPKERRRLGILEEDVHSSRTFDKLTPNEQKLAREKLGGVEGVAGPGGETAAPGVSPVVGSELQGINVKGRLIDRTVEQLDDLIDKLDDVEDKIPEEIYNADLEKIAAAKKIVKANSPLVGQKLEPTSRYPSLTASEQELAQKLALGQKIGGVEGNQMVNEVRRAQRFRAPVLEYHPDDLNIHANELKSMLKDVTGVEKSMIEQRLKDVLQEQANRAKGDATQHSKSIFKDERGFIKLSPDPLELHGDRSHLPQYTRDILGHIGEGPPSKIATLRQRWLQFRFLVENKTIPLIEATKIMTQGRYLPGFLDPAKLAQMYSGWAVRAEKMLLEGPFRWTEDGRIVMSAVKGLAETMHSVRGRFDEFRAYELAARTVELAKVGKASGIELSNATREIANVDPVIAEAHNQAVAFSNEIIKYAMDAGGFSPEAAQAMIDMYPHYTPLLRIFEGGTAEGAARTISSKGILRDRTSTSATNPVKRLIGGTDKVMDPIQARVDLARKIIRFSDRNRIFRSLVELAESNPEMAQGLVEKVEGPTNKTISAKHAEIVARTIELAKEAGKTITPEAAEELVDNMTARELGRNNSSISFWRNGKRESWRVHPDIARALESLDPKNVEWWVKMLAAPARLLRGGVVYNPLFWPGAAIKDAFEATLRSEYGFMPWDSAIGFAHALSDTALARMLGIKPTEYYKLFKAAGGAFSTLSGVRGQTTDAAVRAVLGSNEGVGGFARGVVQHPIEILKRASEPFEEAARIGEFRLAMKNGASAFDAGLAAKNITIDFNMSGAGMQSLSMTTAFLNPAIQSLSADGRALWRNPNRVLAVGMGLASATALMWYANKDDQELNDLRKTPYGRLWMWFRGPKTSVNPDGIYKIPKPYFWGQVFMTGMEQTLDKMYAHDPEAMQDWFSSMAQQAEFTVLPNVLNYARARWSNQDPLTGAQIVPEVMQGIEPAYQVKPSTTFIAEKIGGATRKLWRPLQVSPAQVDYGIGALFGALGQNINKSVNIALNTDARTPDPAGAEAPFIGRLFGSYPTMNTGPIDKFYNRAKDFELTNNTLLYLSKHEPQLYEEYATKHMSDIALANLYSSTRQSINQMRAAIEALNMVPEMTKGQYQGLREQYLLAIIEMARQTNEAADKVNQAVTK